MEQIAKGDQPVMLLMSKMHGAVLPSLHTHLQARNNPAPDAFFLSFFLFLPFALFPL